MTVRRLLLAVVLASVAVPAASLAVTGSRSLEPVALSKARAIKTEVSARYVRGPKLRVTEASPTNTIEYYLLLSADLLGLRVVPAENGIHYAICPVGATCPYPRQRSARPPLAFAPRREALELAVRTFLETSATLVSVALPTRDYVFFIVERDELVREADLPGLARALSGNPARAPAASLREIVDGITLPRLFVSLGLEPTPSGRQALGAVPLSSTG